MIRDNAPLQQAVVDALSLSERNLVVKALNDLDWEYVPELPATLDNLHTFHVAYMAYALGTLWKDPVAMRAMREISRLQQMADRGEL